MFPLSRGKLQSADFERWELLCDLNLDPPSEFEKLYV